MPIFPTGHHSLINKTSFHSWPCQAGAGKVWRQLHKTARISSCDPQRFELPWCQYICKMMVTILKCLVNERLSYLKGPPENGGNPSPKTAPMSPSSGVARMPSWRLATASLANLRSNTVVIHFMTIFREAFEKERQCDKCLIAISIVEIKLYKQ